MPVSASDSIPVRRGSGIGRRKGKQLTSIYPLNPVLQGPTRPSGWFLQARQPLVRRSMVARAPLGHYLAWPGP